MSVSVQLSPQLGLLARAIGLVDSDGSVDAGWFDDPVARLRTILSDPQRRAALLALLEELLPSAPPGGAAPGARWHPLLDGKGAGNVYVFVEGDVIGVAGAIGAAPQALAGAQASLRLPLVDLSSGSLEVVAGTARGPLEIEVRAAWDPDENPSALAVRATVDLEGGGLLRVAFENLDPDRPGVRTEIDPTRLDGAASDALLQLLADVLAELPTDDARVRRVADHLPGVLGLDPILDPLPMGALLRDPSAIVAWFRGIAAGTSTLGAWFRHVAGLLGAGLPHADEPPVTGSGTAALPFRTPLVDLGDGAALELTLGVDTAPAGARELHLGVALSVATAVARLEGGATLLALPLDGAAPARMLPGAKLAITTPATGSLVDAAPTVKVGAISAGFAWDGARVVPRLELADVVMEGKSYPRLDLTDAGAVAEAATGLVSGKLDELLGAAGAGRALQALVGLVPPSNDPSSPHRLSLSTLVQNPTRAIADVHRHALADPLHPWSHVFEELAVLLQASGGVTGDGTRARPWRFTLASLGASTLDLAAWNARTSETPAGTERLRLGLRLGFGEPAGGPTGGPISGGWTAELLALDLRPDAPATAAFLGGQHLALEAKPGLLPATAAGLQVTLQDLAVEASWIPGGASGWSVAARGLSVAGAGGAVGPVTVSLSPATLDPHAPDLGLGLGADTLTALVRLLLSQVLHDVGGSGAFVLGALLGLHRELPGLPEDWPLLAPPAPDDFGSLLSDPLGAIRAQLERVALGQSADGMPFAVTALPWAASLLTGALPARAAEALRGLRPHGLGTHAAPWAVPVPIVDSRLELLCWMEPDGPPKAWQAGAAAQLRDAVGADALLALLGGVAPLVPELASALRARGTARVARQLAALSAWLGSGDGFFPTAAQTVSSAAWATGATVLGAHLDQPSDPAAIAQIRAQLDAWAGAGPRAVLLVGPPFADHRAWDDLLRAAEPSRSAGTHLDFRVPGADPLLVPLDHVEGRAQHYTADLADGSLENVATQLGRAVERVRQLTGVPKVLLVAHSLAGLAARTYAAAHPEAVGGIITLGTPHRRSPVAPLAEVELAEAVRVVEALQPTAGRSPHGRAVGALAALLDGGGGALGALSVLLLGDPGEPPLPEAIPGLAIPGALDGDLLEDLAASAAERIARAADGVAPPTSVGLGARLRIDLPAAEAGGIAVVGRVRVDALRVGMGAADGLGRAGRALEVRLDVLREGGWLAGGPGAGTPARLRWAELGVRAEASESGGVTVEPILRLHEVGARTRPCVDEEELKGRAGTLPGWLPLAAGLPADGTPERLVVEVLRAAGILTADGTGRLALAVDALVATLLQPAERLGPRLAAVADAFAAALGARAVAGGWAVSIGESPLEVFLGREPWTLVLRTRDDAGGAGALELAPGLSIDLDASVALATFTASAQAALRVGDAALAWSSAAGALTLDDGSAAAPLTLLPAPRSEVLRDALARRLPPMLAGAVASAVIAGLTGGTVRLRRLSRLFASPGAWLLSPDGLGRPGGGLDAGRITALLEAAGRKIGSATPGGLALPGGIALTAAGADPVQLALRGTLALGGSDSLDLQLGLAVDRALAASPSGAATFRVTLPGQWGQLAVSIGIDPAGLAVSVAPSGEAAIQLLPRFSGFGALAAGAARLLPKVLQAAVDALAPVPQDATGLLGTGLSIARALGIYDFDAQGFEEESRAKELARMLEPGWLQAKASSGTAVAQLVATLFGGPSPVIDVPGDVTASGPLVTWRLPVAGVAEVTASIGWAGAGAEPSILLGVSKVRVGPVVVDELSAGYEGGPACHVALHLEPGAPISFLQPAIDLDVAEGRLAFACYPLGATAQADFAIRVAPAPELVLHAEAALTLLERWGLPLAAQLLVHELGAQLDQTFYPGLPTIRSVLEQAGVLVRGSSPPQVAPSLPPVAAIALRALAALTSNVTFELVPGALSLGLVQEGGRRGLRLVGHQQLAAGDVAVDLRFGTARWLEDPAKGVTLWLLEDTSDPVPFRITPALELTGLGVVVSGVDGPMLQGSFELGGAGAFLFVRFELLDAARNPALAVSGIGAAVELDQARINIAGDDGDSFLAKVLPPELRAPFDLAVAWREGKGLTFYGGAPGGGLELTFPLDLDLAIIRIEELFLALRAQDGAASAEAALTGSASLGPIFASVQRVGLRATFAPGGTKLGFRFPDGIALSIDAGPVSGGGFLFIDEPRGQYAGALQLNLQTLSITAIGLLSTKLPNGDPIPGLGFSLLLIIAVELPPIQLGFGFTLNGIGGLLGLNRTMDLAALRAGVRNRALDAMLFPPDPIKNATAVVQTLSAVFPVAEDRFVIGPMIRLGWGTPSILTLDLAVFLEIPEPIRVAILGRIKLVLPDEDAAVVKIHLDVVGAIDFGLGEVSIDAILYDSIIAAFTLTGGMALRARWKDDPMFVLAIGGFHPAFPPPPGFPSLDRVAIALATGDNPRLRLEAYLAVTSNTVQFGSAIDLHAEACGFAIDGHLGFDALIQFDPFGLMADMGAAFSVTYQDEVICAVNAAIHLTGPSPWHVWGKAKVELLLLSAEVSFDAHIGEAALPPPPPPVRVSDLVLAALAEPANWSAQAPAGEGVVGLRSSPGGAPLAHPLGGLTFRQRIAPLELTLERYGTAAVDGPARLEVGEIRCGDRPVPDEDREDVRDPFAPAQFLALSDDEKLSRPSFEPFTSGVALHFDGWVVDELGAAEAAALDYEVAVVDGPVRGTQPGRSEPRERVVLAAGTAVELARRGPAAASLARKGGLRRFRAPAAAVAVEERRFGVVRERGARGSLATARTVSQATEAARRLARHGERLAVVPLPSEDDS